MQDDDLKMFASLFLFSPDFQLSLTLDSEQILDQFSTEIIFNNSSAQALIYRLLNHRKRDDSFVQNAEEANGRTATLYSREKIDKDKAQYITR